MLAAKGSPFQSSVYSHLNNISSSSISSLSPLKLQQSTNNNIKVVCRFRPQNQMEIENGGKKSVIFDRDFTAVQFTSFGGLNQYEESSKAGSAPSTPSSSSNNQAANIFRFDRLFDEAAEQEEVFRYTAESIVDDVMKGYNGTILAYGQTGAGKTFTMMGDVQDTKDKGIMPRIVNKVFDMIVNSSSDLEFTVKVSFMEIYMERVRDLLRPMNDNLPVHEDKGKGVYVKGLLEVFVGSIEEVLEVMTRGQSSRAVGSTSMNSESSRSHSIFQLCITQKNTLTGSTKTGKLSLVDLAGSEKAGKTGAKGQTLEEAKKINKSLSSLGNVINSLTDGKSAHIPYRDSKLTRILQESLGGNARTSLIINCSPSSFNEAETISTLRFGVRAKSIKNNAKINTELSPSELKTLLKQAKLQISRLEGQVTSMSNELDVWRKGGQVADSEWTPIWSEPSAIDDNIMEEESIFNESIPRSASGELPLDTLQEYLQREVELKDRIAEKDSLVTDLQDQVDALKADLAENKVLMETRLAEGEKVHADLSEVRLALEKAVYEAKDSSLSLEGMREDNSSLLAQVEGMKVEVELLRSKIAEPSPSSTTSSQDISQLQQELQQIQSQLSDSNNTITHLNSALENVKEENGCVVKRLDTVQSTLLQVQNEYQELLEQTFSHNDDPSESDPVEMEKQVREKLEHQFQAKVEQYQQEASYLKDVLAHKEQEIKDYADLIQDHARMNDTLKAQIKKSLEKSRMDLSANGQFLDTNISLLSLTQQHQDENPNSDPSSKTFFFQRAFDQLGMVQTQLVSSITQLRKEKAINAKKLESRSERIEQIEAQLSNALSQNSILEARYKEDIGVLEEKLKEAYSEIKAKALSTPWIQSSKIAKPLRGGGASADTSTLYPETSHSTHSSPQKQSETRKRPGYHRRGVCKGRDPHGMYRYSKSEFKSL